MSAQPLTASAPLKPSGLFDPRTFPFLAQHEGTVLKAYRCPAGVITIGNGFTMGSRIFADYWRRKHGRGLKLGDMISKAECADLLPRLVEDEYGATLGRELPLASPGQRGASVSMLFNCGPGAKKWRWFTFLKAGNANQAAAALEVTATTARGRRLPGLVRRRKEEADIIEIGNWPDWVKVPADLSGESIDKAKPVKPLGEDDFDQGVIWLVELKTLAAAHDDDDIRTAVLKFQAQHPQLTADGILGRATLDQLQRVIDLKRKAATSAGSGAAAGGAGGVDVVNSTSGYGEWIVAGSLVFILVALGYLAWRYRDELSIALKRVK